MVEVDENTGYVKEPEEDRSLFGYLEAAYGVERAESLTIDLYKKIEEAGNRAGRIIRDGPPETKMNPREVFEEVNEIESLVDYIEIEIFGEDA